MPEQKPNKSSDESIMRVKLTKVHIKVEIILVFDGVCFPVYTQGHFRKGSQQSKSGDNFILVQKILKPPIVFFSL